MNSSIPQNHLTNSFEEEACQFAMQLASASILPMALKAATELDVLGIISRAGPGATLTPLEIASQLPTQNPEAPMVLDRILRVLASHSVLTCSHLPHDDGQVQRLYGLAPVCKCFFVDQDGVSMAPLLHLIQDKVLMESWYQLKDAVVEGGNPFHRVHGMNAFEYLGKDPRFRKVFSSAMFNYTTITMKKILETYKGFEGLKELVDVGGREGITLNMIISKYPAIKGINFDLPHIIAHAPSYPGVKHIGGDMFATVPKGEAIFMKWILHGWSDEYCLKLLKNCYKALPDHGKVVAVDLIIPAAPDTSVATKGIFQMDLFMMVQNSGGKERTEKEFKTLAKGAGFSELNWCVVLIILGLWNSTKVCDTNFVVLGLYPISNAPDQKLLQRLPCWI